MYSVDEIIEQIDQESDVEDNLDNLEDNVNNSQEDGDAAEGTGNSTRIKPKVKRSLGSRPKLDAERLKGPRGLICMESLFSELKFKGYGYEKQDLNEVMKKLQYWCHRLFPKFTFDDCLAQLERLGTKKPVITLKRKILFDMTDDLVPHNVDVIDDVTESQQEVLNDFDMLLNQEPSTSTFTPQPAVTAEVIELTEEQKDMIAKNRQLAAERRRARLEAVKEKQNDFAIQSSQTSPSNSQPLNLTEDQKLIIEKNRLLAVEKRRQLQNKSNNLLQTSSLNLSQKSTTSQENINETLEQMEDSSKAVFDQETSERLNQENLSQKDNESIMDVHISQETNCESEILIRDLHKLD